MITDIIRTVLRKLDRHLQKEKKKRSWTTPNVRINEKWIKAGVPNPVRNGATQQ